MKKFLFLFLIIQTSLAVFAEEYKIDNVYPTHWWVGMKNTKLQLLLHGANVSENSFSISYPGVKLVKTHKAENKNYIFLDVSIAASAKPGKLKIHVTNENGEVDYLYELKPRRKGNGTLYAQGVTAADFIYLLMPDRFSNGDVTNDQVAGMSDPTFSRDSMYFRHGGDLQGIRNHLDYFQELGVTALWLNPVLENDMPRTSYHGYAFTDHYKIDARLGGDTAYKNLIDAMHRQGLKMIQDAVFNHVGTEHWFVKDLPSKDWLHQWPAYTNTTYKDQVLFDPYASAADRKKMSDGWFVPSMPDLNQQNPFVANFLIQHAIWTVEEFGIDGWRVDTYAYNDLHFMNRCNKALLTEFPKLTIFGETWVHGVINQSFFTRNKYSISYKSNQPGVTDFQVYWGITDAQTKEFGWTDGVNRLYTTLAQDFVYQDPMKNVIFFDNHDISRFYSVVWEDMAKYKMSIAWLLTLRGIPQWYYGAEIGMKGFASPDGLVRLDFSGGWPGDQANKFTSGGRTELENDIFNHVKKLAQYRKSSSALKTGKLMQFVPEEGVYAYFRYDQQQAVMVISHTGTKHFNVTMSRFEERTKGFSKLKNVVTGEIRNLEDFTIKPKESFVFELMK